MFLDVDKATRKLDETLEEVVRLFVFAAQPKLFKHVVGFVVMTAVEAREVSKVVGWPDAIADIGK